MRIVESRDPQATLPPSSESAVDVTEYECPRPETISPRLCLPDADSLVSDPEITSVLSCEKAAAATESACLGSDPAIS
jgi:hypothetical protein